jgi:membrane carboxypeptidase/penicillin-binding protein
VHSTIDAQLQRDTEAALQEGLARYELSSGRMQFRGPEANIGDAVRKLESDNRAGTPAANPAWQQALQAVHLPLYDVHWTPAVVLSKGDGKKGDGGIRVGLPDGRILPLAVWSATMRRGLGPYDVVYVHVVESKGIESKSVETRAKNRTGAGPVQSAGQGGGQAQLRVRPTVQGAALVLENKTGRILAMAGSFSYPLSQLNRVAQSQRQPGSAMKPLTYLTALQHGLQPNTLVPNEPITLPPIGGSLDGRDVISRDYGGYARPQDFWSPRNADYNEGGLFTMRRGLENSINVVTAHLLDGGISSSPEKSLDAVCATAVAAKIYSECVRYYPFVLGAQPVRMIDLAAFYAAVANEGALPQPHGIDSIEENGHAVYEYPKTPLPWIGAADRASFYQLKTMLQGVVARGTARAIGGLSPYVAGKTGTTEDAVDGWFIGFTNDVTVAVWVGYDNANHKRRSLGTNATGARVALPIFEPIIQAIWAEQIAPKAALSGPSPEARQMLADVPIDYATGNRVAGGGFIEHFRRDAAGQIEDTQYQLASRDGYYGDDQWGDNGFYWGGDNRGPWIGRSYYPNWRSQPPQPPPVARGFFQPWSNNPFREFFWGGRVN